MKLELFIAIQIIVGTSIVKAESSFRVNISNGVIEGREFIASYSPFGNQTGIVFFGIPHIEPPVGDLRFRKPIRNEKKWNSTLETKHMKAACMSDPVDTYKRPEGGPTSEDCLYTNVYTNHYCLKHKNCSVMVAIHGGQMLRENPATFRSEVIINNFVGQDRNIVVVTFSFRLGVFGLPNLPGEFDNTNLALYDVVMGLEWTHREISNFGGIPDKTTLFGHSGGAIISAMISFLPQFDHLFQQRVSMSLPMQPHSKSGNSEFLQKVAMRLGCEGSNEQTLECLRKVPADMLYEIQNHVFHNEEEFFTDFAVDGKILVDYPRQLIQNQKLAKKPLMLGTVPYEVLYSQYLLDEKGHIYEKELNEICELFAFTGAYENPYEFVEKCKEHYRKKENAPYLIDDYLFKVPHSHMARTHSKQNPVYLYYFTYSVGFGFSEYEPDLPSPVHSEDFTYYLGVHRTENFTMKDYRIEKILTGMVAEFVNTGDPNLKGIDGKKWETLDPRLMNYFEIDFDDNLTMTGMKNGYGNESFEFWNGQAVKSGGNFTYLEEFPPTYDVFTGVFHAEMKNTVRHTKAWVEDKTEATSKRGITELQRFLEKKKDEYNSKTSTVNGVNSILVFSFVFLVLVLKV